MKLLLFLFLVGLCGPMRANQNYLIPRWKRKRDYKVLGLSGQLDVDQQDQGTLREESEESGDGQITETTTETNSVEDTATAGSNDFSFNNTTTAGVSVQGEDTGNSKKDDNAKDQTEGRAAITSTSSFLGFLLVLPMLVSKVL